MLKAFLPLALETTKVSRRFLPQKQFQGEEKGEGKEGRGEKENGEKGE